MALISAVYRCDSFAVFTSEVIGCYPVDTLQSLNRRQFLYGRHVVISRIGVQHTVAANRKAYAEVNFRSDPAN